MSVGLPSEEMHAWVDAELDRWKVPGLALAVVKDGAVIWRGGFGLRDREGARPVTPQTIFAIGSATKAFTALSVGLLVDENKLDWDTPVREYLPAFRLHDPFASERMTPRDLLTHRSGLPRHDAFWYNSPLSRDELFARLRYLEPNKDFRSYFQYQNLMYMTAGYLVGHVARTSWEAFVSERILQPLGMRSTNFSVAHSQEAADHALPYLEKDGEVRQTPFRNISTVGPAGSINSNLDDMLQWLQLHLNGGTHNGGDGATRIISEGALAQLHTSQMVVQDAQMRSLMQAEMLSYCLGWFTHVHRGHLLLHHGGNIDGFSALVSFMPAERLGILALSNLNGTGLPTAVTYALYDRLLGLDDAGWSPRLKLVYDALTAALKASKETAAADRRPDAPLTHPLAEYAGEYEHPGYGVARVTVEGAALRVTYNDIPFAAEHQHFDIFQLRYEPLEMTIQASFLMDVKGNIDRLCVQAEPSVAEIVFTRLPDRTLQSRAHLERFVGEYTLLGMTLRIELKGEQALSVVLPGQPEQELVPYSPTEFTVKGLTGFSVRFTLDADGRVTGGQLVQPGATLPLTRNSPDEQTPA